MSDKIIEILERARWAPSGDNCQPWKFEILSDYNLRIHVSNDIDNVYETSPKKPSWIAAGALVENIRLVAATKNMLLKISKVTEADGGSGCIDIVFMDESVEYDPLEKYIETRTVCRTAFKTTDLPDDIINDLEKAVGSEFTLRWHTGMSGRLKMLRVNALASNIRLMIKETFEIHKSIIDWNNCLSPDKIPAKALGFSNINLALTKWATQSWARLNFMNKYFAGAIFPQLELDVLPSLFCARHFTLAFKNNNQEGNAEDFLKVGRAVQRLWLMSTHHGLNFQPAMAALLFASYVTNNLEFTQNMTAMKKAKKLSTLITIHTGFPIAQQAFQGRVGFPLRKGDTPCRSVRKPLCDLMDNT